MIKNVSSDIRVDTGRCQGGSFVRVIHIPSGLSRYLGPIGLANVDTVVRKFLLEIEEELKAKGKNEYIAG
jgi:hypothetical protein